MDKKVSWLLLLLINTVGVLAYHGTGRGSPFGGAKLPGWSLLVILAVVALLAYLGWRWWRKINESAFR